MALYGSILDRNVLHTYMTWLLKIFGIKIHHQNGDVNFIQKELFANKWPKKLSRRVIQ